MTRATTALRATAIAACLPYLALKVTWITGSHLGIPENSTLLDHRSAMIVANTATVLMDACVIVLALLLTRPWGQRAKAWLLVIPVWVAGGLLTPIMTGFPVQLLVRALGGSVKTDDPAGKAFLDGWVFGVVYTGFIVQGLALGALFVAYARRRWGHLWQGRVWELPGSPTRPAQQTVAVAAAVFALLPLVVHVQWALGSTAGLSEGRAQERTSDFYVLEALDVAFVALAVAGALMLAFRIGRPLPVKVPLAMAWVGSAVLACWGGWLNIASLTGVDDPADRPTALMNLTYSGQMIVGMLVAAIGAYFFAERTAGRTADRVAAKSRA
ncbi:hypothetical protein [Streptomyces sp. NBC_01304]|uniref:hypothetical protein n=1 Tax=Streptomyces sp. NBC_01304 TaxID=2903818 RepID=UPI002E14D3D0|nr:hypothetical protein OG430_36985 [Streptomyces sp. NBC_01304]